MNVEPNLYHAVNLVLRRCVLLPRHGKQTENSENERQKGQGWKEECSMEWAVVLRRDDREAREVKTCSGLFLYHHPQVQTRY